MRRRLCALMMTLLLALTACGGAKGDRAEDLMLEARSRYLEMTACSGHLELTADYGQRVYTFGVDLAWAKEGETTLTLTAPEEVAGVTARIARGETALEYDGVAVETGALDSDGLSPMDAPMALLKCAQEGFLAECVLEGEGEEALLHVTCRDPEKDPGAGVETQLWLHPETFALTRGEISQDGFTVIQCDVSDFSMECPPNS